MESYKQYCRRTEAGITTQRFPFDAVDEDESLVVFDIDNFGELSTDEIEKLLENDNLIYNFKLFDDYTSNSLFTVEIHHIMSWTMHYVGIIINDMVFTVLREEDYDSITIHNFFFKKHKLLSKVVFKGLRQHFYNANHPKYMLLISNMLVNNTRLHNDIIIKTTSFL